MFTIYFDMFLVTLQSAPKVLRVKESQEDINDDMNMCFLALSRFFK